MAELVDVRDLGSRGAIRVGSTPTTRTKKDGAPRARRPFSIGRTCQNGVSVGCLPWEEQSMVLLGSCSACYVFCNPCSVIGHLTHRGADETKKFQQYVSEDTVGKRAILKELYRQRGHLISPIALPNAYEIKHLGR